ncbi:tetratricopeptide repeat domain 26 [Brevipalpus obovatus]|uniref:tetratricopeptide repeat domain 26 n=1 Tax=Brevipalpus obovatus TaxID=246614 RepID=UPI003D9E1BDF
MLLSRIKAFASNNKSNPASVDGTDGLSPLATITGGGVGGPGSSVDHIMPGRSSGLDGFQKQGSGSSRRTLVPSMHEFLAGRDYIGAITLLKYNKASGKDDPASNDLWTAYAYFHLGEYELAVQIYDNYLKSMSEESIKKSGDNTASKSFSESKDSIYLYIACCQFLSGEHKEAEKNLSKSSKKNDLRNRLELHLAHRNRDEKILMQHHQALKDSIQDQLCLASIHYLRSHFQEAIDIYKKILLEHREFVALNVYVALCYYKLDYYDVSQEVIGVYLQHYPDSVTAVNLKACNHYRLYNGKAAENELRTLIDNASSSFTYAKDLIRHNLVVFRNGEGAMQVLPGLIDVIPEARLNLVIRYLKQDNILEAFNLVKDLEPSVPHEYILKGVVNATYGQEKGFREYLKVAQQFFHLVGGSASECDTIPGRQCMASCFFLMKQFDDVLLYLSSIKSYFHADDAFNFNYGQAKAVTGNFVEAEEAFLAIKDEKILNDPIYVNWMIRCYIMNKKPEKAWQLYKSCTQNGSESLDYLNLIANDCYKMGSFLHSARAFDQLEKLDSSPEFWEGKRGACIGVFQLIIVNKEPRDSLYEVMKILRNSDNPQADQIIKIMKTWDKESKSNTNNIT